jgi:hypothetical protein
MGFNGVGFATIAPDGDFQWSVLRNGGQDFGAQYVSADPLTVAPVLGRIISDNQMKVRFPDGHVEYFAIFHNRSLDTTTGQSVSVGFSMQCGGFADP